MKSIRSRTAGALACALLLVSWAADAQVRTFRDPTYGGYAIDYCGIDSSSCGEGVANSWCRSQSYEHATEWSATSGALDAVVVRLEDGRVCRGAECEAFESITCSRSQADFRMPRLGAAGRATVLQPGGRGAAVAYELVEVESLIPGCHQREPGIYLCGTSHEYQHCRTLMQQGQVHSCRAGLAFDGGFATPVAPQPGEYRLDLDSDIEIRVEQGKRGEGKFKGDAEVEIEFRPPATLDSSWCLQRDRYVYYPTGPRGGIGDIDDTADCGAPVSATFEPNEDDMLVAYDLCTTFEAWGNEIDHKIDVLVGALFHLGSASPSFRSQYKSDSTIIAPYLTVEAPVRIDCKR